MTRIDSSNLRVFKTIKYEEINLSYTMTDFLQQVLFFMLLYAKYVKSSIIDNSKSSCNQEVHFVYILF